MNKFNQDPSGNIVGHAFAFLRGDEPVLIVARNKSAAIAAAEKAGFKVERAHGGMDVVITTATPNKKLHVEMPKVAVFEGGAK